MATRIPTASRNAAADAVVDRLDAGAGAGTVEIRTGGQPASANDAATGTLLATVTLNDPAFGAAATGIATVDVDPALTDTGDAAGDAGWFRAKDSDGNTVIDGSITASGGGGDMTLNTITISVGVGFTITSWTITMPAG
jgi:hypothetical protein